MGSFRKTRFRYGNAMSCRDEAAWIGEIGFVLQIPSLERPNRRHPNPWPSTPKLASFRSFRISLFCFLSAGSERAHRSTAPRTALSFL